MMGIQYFYNFCITALDDTDLNSDILSAVRRSYFAAFEKIRDKITYDSEGDSLLYDYSIEKNKPLRWTVKKLKGTLMEEVIEADEGRYYLCFYRDEKLFKRLLFSKLHTLLKAEYMDDSGSVRSTLEPRKSPGGLCLLYTDTELEEPVVLSSMPDVNDPQILERLREQFTDYSAVASTNEGVVWFMDSQQTARFKELVEQISQQIEDERNFSFIGEDAPLFERISAKDFNIKRNLSASLDITKAKDFGAPAEELSEEEGTSAEDNEEIIDTVDESSEVEEDPGIKPDKLIMADGAVYSYYGELDDDLNRSGYGRTITDIGRIAYEGMYRNDKRSGKGAYFYKDGTLCYSGDWSENVRHGVGVGVSAKDGSMHIGRWVNNKPEGNGVRLTAEGEIKFVCKELSDGGTVLTQYRDDDTILISRYDKNGSKISEKSVSLTDT